MPEPNNASPNLLEQAQTQYPVLKNYDIGYKESFGQRPEYLEFWNKGEEGDVKYPRPKELPVDKPGLEIYRKETRPIDIIGDVVSHYLVDVDPKVKATYEAFQKSLTPAQELELKKYYAHSKKEWGETRPYEEWKRMSGMPAIFRGYPFKQWPEERGKYTPGQKKLLDDMMQYLEGKYKPHVEKILQKVKENKLLMQTMKPSK